MKYTMSVVLTTAAETTTLEGETSMQALADEDYFANGSFQPLQVSELGEQP